MVIMRCLQVLHDITRQKSAHCKLCLTLDVALHNMMQNNAINCLILHHDRRTCLSCVVALQSGANFVRVFLSAVVSGGTPPCRYVLSNIESTRGIRKGDRIWQIAFGSGFKCNSAVWRSMRNNNQQHEAWTETPKIVEP